MRPGVNWRSDGIKVGEMAGMPSALIDVAEVALVDMYHQMEVEERTLQQRGRCVNVA
jgi:DNA mismatch repair ATPase MutS